MNTNAIFMAVVARYLSSAEFRKAVLANSDQALMACNLDANACREFSEFDFQSLESFGGLITKTQHNFLYEYLPCTRQLLQVYKLDLTIFAAYRSEVQAKPMMVTSRFEKVRAFVSYLRSWLHGRDDAFPGLADLLEHEYILWTLKSEPVSDIAEPAVMGAGPTKLRCSRPAVRPGVRLAEFRYHPLRIINCLEQGGRPQKDKRRRYRFVYWIDTPNSQIRIAEAGRTVWNVIRLCNGKRHLRTLYRELAPLRPAAIRDALAFARTSGLILMRKPE